MVSLMSFNVDFKKSSHEEILTLEVKGFTEKFGSKWIRNTLTANTVI